MSTSHNCLAVHCQEHLRFLLIKLHKDALLESHGPTSVETPLNGRVSCEVAGRGGYIPIPRESAIDLAVLERDNDAI